MTAFPIAPRFGYWVSLSRGIFWTRINHVVWELRAPWHYRTCSERHAYKPPAFALLGFRVFRDPTPGRRSRVDPLLRLRISRFRFDSYCVGLFFLLQIAPAGRLRTRSEEGRYPLVGFELDAGIGWPLETIQDQQVHRHWYRPRVWWRVRSDAGEIAARLAANAQTPADSAPI